jgi:hypothetical protein
MPTVQRLHAGGEDPGGGGIMAGDRFLDFTDALLAGVELLFHPLFDVMKDELAEFDVGLEMRPSNAGLGHLP